MSNEIAKIEVGSDIAALDALLEGPTGFEGMDAECIQIPYLKIAQPTSDELKPGTPVYIKDLKMGDFFVPAIRKVIGPEAKLVALKFYRSYAMYDGVGPASKFKGIMDPDTYDRTVAPFARREKSYTLDQNGYRYVDTRNFVVLDYTDLESGPMIFGLTSTGISPSKKWLTMAQNIHVKRNGIVQKAPMWVAVWTLKTAMFTNDQGSYYQINTPEQTGFVHGSVAQKIKNDFDDAQAIESSRFQAQADTEPVVAPAQEASASIDAVSKVFGPKGQPATKNTDPDSGLF